MITSTQNTRIKWVRSLQSSSRDRRQEGAFVTEGVRLAEEALASSWEPELILYTEDLNERGQVVVQDFLTQGAPVEIVTEQVMQHASDTQSPQGILVVLRQRTLPLPKPLDFVFIPDGVRDPGNLGTMLRTAAAAGAGAVLLPPGTVDLFSPKVVRAAMGAHFRLPTLHTGWDEIVDLLELNQLSVYLAAAGQGLPYTQVDFHQPCALIIGGEAAGAGAAARRLAGEQVHIPMPGGMESLNAAIAAAILLFEVVRQRS